MIEEHLLARPRYRNSGVQENIQAHQKFNEWIIANGDRTEPKMILINNEVLSIDETAKQVKETIEKCLKYC